MREIYHFLVSRLVVERKQRGVRKLMLDGFILLSEVLNLCFELHEIVTGFELYLILWLQIFNLTNLI